MMILQNHPQHMMCHMLSLMRNCWRCFKENFSDPDYEYEEGEEDDHDVSQVYIVEPNPSICLPFVFKSHITNHTTAPSSLVPSPPNSSSQLPQDQRVCFSTQTNVPPIHFIVNETKLLVLDSKKPIYERFFLSYNKKNKQTRQQYSMTK